MSDGRARGARFVDMTGKRSGRLLVVSEAGRHGRSRQVMWRCRCDCGQETIVQGHRLRTGHTKSCGCIGREIILERNANMAVHRMSKTPEYTTWRAMISRCHCSSSGNYYKYGARGVYVCHRWRFGEGGKTGFECFYEDMGAKPSQRHSIDRYPDPAGNYEPGNCRWATIHQQRYNRRSTGRQ